MPRRRVVLEEGGMMEKESSQDRVRTGVGGQMAVAARGVNLGQRQFRLASPRGRRRERDSRETV
jgi:hypothetical protein